MKNLSLINIAKACKGILKNCENLKDKEVSDIVIDSRKVTEGCLFVAIKGNRVDGHDFIEEVTEKNVLCSVSEKELNINVPYILVESTTDALMDIAAFYRKSLDIKVVGITGSVGKTSTKEMIATVLEEKYNVLKTEGNFNNQIGLPLTIFRLREEHEIAVLEMGISHFGDMEELAAIATPDVCVITNIGYCHLENLIDRDGVLKAKTAMFKYMEKGGTIILNGDDDKLSAVRDYEGIKPVFFGLDNKNSVYADNVKPLGMKGTSFTLKDNSTSADVTLIIPGIHMVSNALAATAVGKTFNMNLNEIKNGIEKLDSVKGRNTIIETEKYTILDDCYNANPVSTKASIDLLTYADGRKVAILGDMFELGENEAQLHAQVGIYCAEKNIDYLICIGKLSKNTYEAAMKNGIKKADYFSEKAEFLEKAKQLLEVNDQILIKASHGMNFSEITKNII